MWLLATVFYGYIFFVRMAPSIMVVMLLSFVAAVYAPGIPLWLVEVLFFVNGLAVGSCMIAYAAAREHNRRGAVATTTAVVIIMGTGFGGALRPVIGCMLDLRWEGRMEGDWHRGATGARTLAQ